MNSNMIRPSYLQDGDIVAMIAPAGVLKQNHEVVCFNRGTRGTLPKNVRLIKGDRSDSENFEKTLKN